MMLCIFLLIGKNDHTEIGRASMVHAPFPGSIVDFTPEAQGVHETYQVEQVVFKLSVFKLEDAAQIRAAAAGGNRAIQDSDECICYVKAIQ